MAKITLGLGTAHGPQLTISPDQWYLRVQADRQNKNHWFQGKKYIFDELVELRGAKTFEKFITAEARQNHFQRCQIALRKTMAAYEQAKPDIAIIFGNDQFEIFRDINIPALAIFCGDTFLNIPKTEEQLAKLPPGIAPAEKSYCPREVAHCPGHPELAKHLIASLVGEGFDLAQSNAIPVGPNDSCSIPHAYGFIYHTVMSDQLIPSVPVFINTHNPPNRPTAARCIEFGRALARAVQNWPSNLSVALIASGGWTHYVIDEDFDRMILDAMMTSNTDKLRRIDEAMFESGGTAEIKNWLPVYGAMTETGLAMNLIDYVPCYRSEAGTGNAMAFANWL